MLNRLLQTVFGSRNERLIKRYTSRVQAINQFESSLQPLSDAELAAKTPALRARLDQGETLDQLLPEAFAVCREASRRVLRMRHFDVQMVGGMVLHEGKIPEMRTGEGKTLVATLAVYLNALTSKGVHVVTVNDYLARRDAEWMSRLYGFLGLTTGISLSGMDPEAKRAAYACDITYGTNNEYGFDYLRDNMVAHIDQRVQRGLNFAVIDEVDSILIDEARTPLIISGVADDSVELYEALNGLPAHLTRQETEESEGDYYVDEKGRQLHLSETGFEKAEQLLGEFGLLPSGASLYDPAQVILLHHLMAALRAHVLYIRDQHYVVQKGQVVIVDEFTGRLMPGRRWGDGLHQAVEAKEKVRIEPENQTLASITFQNYFRMYEKLSGMTGTADTEAFEFQQIYGLETVVVPTHRPMQRRDLQDQIFRTAEEKLEAILADIRDCNTRQQPVLVGTTSIESSELLSSQLTQAGVLHQVLNAKQHEREAEIVAQAGMPGMVTIATNMAGRGTDIVLGGSLEKAREHIRAQGLEEGQLIAALEAEEKAWQARHEQVLTAGGLHIIGTERHESRRIDNQLRGRAGRQGDPGSSRFYLSMDDPLLRIFAGDRMKSIMDRLGVPRGEPIESSMVSRSIEGAQRKVENRNFDIRKQLLEYDNVANDQRKVIYKQRNEILESPSVEEFVSGMREGSLTVLFRTHVPEESIEDEWTVAGLETDLLTRFNFSIDLQAALKADDQLDDEGLLQLLLDAASVHYNAKKSLVEPTAFTAFERSVLLQQLDHAWREHLAALDHLRQGIHLRGYAQKDPKQEYKREAVVLFENMLSRIRDQVTELPLSIEIAPPAEANDDVAPAPPEPASVTPRDLQFNHPDFSPSSVDDADGLESTPPVQVADARAAAEVPKVGRNDPCPCGSGKKFKHCHGAF